MEEARKEAERQVEATERALRLTFEEKFQEMLQTRDSSECDLLRQHNKQLTQSVARLTEKSADLQAANEKLSFQVAEKAAAVEAERRQWAASQAPSRWDLQEVRQHSEDAVRSARSKSELDVVRALMERCEEVEGPQLEPSSGHHRRSTKQRAPNQPPGSSSQEQPTPDKPDHLNWTLNAAYHKPKDLERASKSKPGPPRPGIPTQSPGQQPKQP